MKNEVQSLLKQGGPSPPTRLSVETTKGYNLGVRINQRKKEQPSILGVSKHFSGPDERYVRLFRPQFLLKLLSSAVVA